MIKKSNQMQLPLKNTAYTMLNIISNMIHDFPVDIVELKKTDMKELYNYAKNHSLQGIIAMGLESVDPLFDENNICIKKKFKEDKERALRDDLLFDFEWTQIKYYMENNQIWYMPLKGMLLKAYYPKTGIRQMADYDILFDKTFQKVMCNYMVGQGYQSLGVGKGNHDVYQKAPIFNFEFHTALYNSKTSHNFSEYYDNVKIRLIKDKDNKSGYHFTDEDFYIYFLSHSYKHYQGGGTGVRSLLDLYLFLQKKEEHIDWNYITGELKSLQLEEFEKESRELCMKIFSPQIEEITEKEQGILDYYFYSGAYGTMGNVIKNKLANLQSDNEQIRLFTKVKYCIIRLVPGMEHYKNVVPLVYRNKWMIPFYLVFRAISGLVNSKKRKNLCYEINKLTKGT